MVGFERSEKLPRGRTESSISNDTSCATINRQKFRISGNWKSGENYRREMAGASLHLNTTTVLASLQENQTRVHLPEKTTNSRVLVLGGTGRVGGSTAIALSKLCPDLRIIVGGRNRYKLIKGNQNLYFVWLRRKFTDRKGLVKEKFVSWIF